MKYSPEDLEWMQAHPADSRGGWRPNAGTELSANAVNGMTADAQWAYKANSPTPQVKVKGLPPKFPYCDVNALAEYEAGRKAKPRRQSEAARLKAELAAAKARIAELDAILAAFRRELGVAA